MIKLNKTKPYFISKKITYEAYKKVKAKRGASGVDNESIKDFERNLWGNLYKIWNRMSSGSYFPPPVLEVEIPKAQGGKRKLGIPTIADRIAQMVVKIYLEPELEHHFVDNSFGFRPQKSAIQAVEKAKERCRIYKWVLDIDIKGFFDNIDHQLLLKAIERHTDCSWIKLYIKRWLQAPIQKQNGEIEARTKGTPQGGVISPLLANLFLHYAFDKWMENNHSAILFERYADDIIVHCNTEAEAYRLKQSIAKRLEECHLHMHPTKTKIVHCACASKTKEQSSRKFTFLGYTFKPRRCRSRAGVNYIKFTPAVSTEATNKMNSTIKKRTLIHQSHITIQALADNINPIMRGWMNYFGQFYKSAMRRMLSYLNQSLIKWVSIKYKRGTRRARKWLVQVARKLPNLFAHWRQAKP